MQCTSLGVNVVSKHLIHRSFLGWVQMWVKSLGKNTYIEPTLLILHFPISETFTTNKTVDIYTLVSTVKVK